MTEQINVLQALSEKLDNERANERQMRLKLEEEYSANARSHEQEVILRLKFEK